MKFTGRVKLQSLNSSIMIRDKLTVIVYKLSGDERVCRPIHQKSMTEDEENIPV